MTYKIKEVSGLFDRVRFHKIAASRWIFPDVIDHGFDHFADPRPKINLLMTFNGKAIGTVRMTVREDQIKSAELWKVTIASDARGKHHGDHLLSLTEKFAVREGISMLCLNSIFSAKVVEFYERNGFQQCDWDEGYVAHGLATGTVPMIKWILPIKNGTTTNTAPCDAGNDPREHKPA